MNNLSSNERDEEKKEKIQILSDKQRKHCIIRVKRVRRSCRQAKRKRQEKVCDDG